MKMTVIFVLAGLVCFSGVCFGWAQEYPASHPVGSVSGWPAGIEQLTNCPQRVAGYSVNPNYELFYQGTTQQLNGFLEQHAKLEHSALWVTIHEDSERKALLWNSKLSEAAYQGFDWKLTILKRDWFDELFETIPAGQDHIVAVDIWLDEGIDKRALVIPNGMAVRPSIADMPEKRRQAGLQKAQDNLVSGNTEFAFALYQQLKGEEGNLFYSPYSISTALAMTYAGARGETAAQMAETLHYWPEQKSFHTMFGYIINLLNQLERKGDCQLSVANALWAQKGYPFLDSFIELNKRHYKAGLENVDFVDAVEREKSRQTINQWVEDQTQDKIKNLIPKGVLDALTRLVLTNAIYFKGDWANAFDAAQTEEAPFYVTPDKSVTAALMFQSNMFEYGQTKQVKVLKLPYKGDDLSMVVLLPREGHTLAEIEAELTAEKFRTWEKLTGPTQVRVFLPRFKMTSQFSLNQTLAAMGMTDAFGGKADFSGMDGTKMLYISAVLHKAFVEVNEEGTEAAAATGVVMTLKSMPPRPTEFRADKPFMFVIKDNHTGSILFVGRVTDPTKE